MAIENTGGYFFSEIDAIHNGKVVETGGFVQFRQYQASKQSQIVLIITVGSIIDRCNFAINFCKNVRKRNEREGKWSIGK